MVRRRAGLLALVVGLLTTAGGWALRGAQPIAGAVVTDATLVAAAVLLFVAVARRRGRVQQAWILVAVAVTLYAAATVTYDWLQLRGGHRPGASAADVLCLASYLALAAGVAAMVRLRTTDHEREGLLDGIALSIASGLVVWQYVVTQAIEPLSGAQLWVNAAYPAMDVLLFMAILWLVFAPGRRSTPSRMLLSGLVLLLVLDVVALVVPGGNGPWTLGSARGFASIAFLLVAAAALHRDAEELTDNALLAFRPLHPARVAVLGAALLTPPSLMAIEYTAGRRTREPLIIGATIVVASIVFIRLAGLLRDRERDQQELTYQASHDGLTGLLNRHLLADRIEHALARASRHDAEIAVLYLDLDRFKAVNDTMGHDAGDALLIQAATRLLGAVRGGDTVARLGGDEFAILCEDLAGPAIAFEIAQRVVDTLSQPFSIGDSMVVVSASVGIAVHNSPEDSAESMLRDADAAMYRAKEHGRHRWEVFDADMRAWVDSRRETEKALQLAVKHGELRLHYQPIVHVATETIVGFEALVRWQRPGVGLVQPGEFIPLAEETGLIVPIGEWVIEHACFQLAQWRAHDPDAGPLYVAMNVSGRQLTQADLAHTVRRSMERAQVDPSSIMLELTESMLLEDADWSLAQLESLKHLGVRVAIDDFGTGYSALAYLRHFPIDVVKIDRAFLQDVGPTSPSATVVSAVVALSHALGLEVVGEGAETAEQVDALHRLGCDHAQGFYYSRPLAAVEVDELLAGGGLRPGRVADRGAA